ncbi:MAG: hypothetical protein ACTSYB_15800 [Candidatus Helarchaeota archaeon]
MDNNLEKERDLILQEYSADYEDENPAEMIIYLSLTPEIHYQIQLNFKNFPEKPEIILPSALKQEIGDPNRFLTHLREWDPHNPPHIVEIIRELEGILQHIIYPNDEMENVMMEFNAHMSGPYRLHVLLYSYKMKTYEFDIIHKKPHPPSLSFSPELEKILKVNELRTLPKWPRFSLIDIVREISRKIDNRTRILDELKKLEKRNDIQKSVRRSLNGKLTINTRIQIETNEFCELEIKLSEEFPLAPPEMELKNVSDDKIREEMNELLISQYNQWQHATTIVELLDDVKAFLKNKSKLICQICHHYKCPKCGKPIQTQIRGISGENECRKNCADCQASFHRCCWVEQIKLMRKCPVCLTPKTILF